MSQTPAFDVVILNTGRVYLDILFGDVHRIPEPGEEIHYDSFSMQAGGAFNTAAGCALLGLKTGIVAEIGSDPFSDFLRGEIARVGIAGDFISRIEGGVTAVTVSISDQKDRRFLSNIRDVPDTPFDPALLDRTRVRRIHMPGYRYAGEMIDVIREIHARGVLLSMDSQSDALSLVKPPLSDLAPLLDVLFCNLSEAQNLTGETDEEAVVRELARFVARPIVKLGAAGALAIEDGRLYRSPGLVVDAVDTTGAGDCFAAGVLWALSRDLGIEAALAAGNFCGAASTTKLGALAGFPGVDAVRESLGVIDP